MTIAPGFDAVHQHLARWMRTVTLGVGCWLLLGEVRAAAPPPVRQWLVVCPPAWRETLEPLVQRRLAEGWRTVVLPPDEPTRLRASLHRLCQQHGGPSVILLAGDLTRVPALVGRAGRMKGQPSDAEYGCPDGARLPSVPVGRMPARSAAELGGMVAKTVAMEQSEPGAWRRRLTVLAGIPAYNPVVDRLLESIAFARFDRLQPTWSGRALYTAAGSRFYLPEHHIRIQALAYLREGQAFILYLGHSNAEGLYAGPHAAFLDRDDWSRLRIERGGSLFVTFGCNGCQLRGPDGEGYGVHAARNPQGPAAVIGSHGICFAAMVQLGADRLFEEALQGGRARTAGDCWLAVLRGVALERIDYLSYRMMDAVDGDPRIPQAAQREEHLDMFVLLGDPALRLPQVRDDIEWTVSESVRPGQVLRVSGKLPAELAEAEVQVSLERTPASVPYDLEPVPADGIARDRALQNNHARSNQFTLVRGQVRATGGTFETALRVPPRVPGTRVILRVHASQGRQEALAARSLKVIAPEEKQAP
ncbi:MAG: C25 family cysteine peptidase [Gemmataceae bacterium]